MSAEFKPERVQRPREQVELQLREAILSGVFAGGDKLPSETDLATQFSVSRTTVREALRALASDGLISKTPGVRGGSFVQGVDHRSLGVAMHDSLENVLRLGRLSHQEVAEVRFFLEVPSARLAARHRDEADLETLHDILAREKGTTVDDPAVPQLDVSFHSVVAHAAKNRALAAFVSALHSATRPVLFVELSRKVGRDTVGHHSRIVAAIADRDEERAGAAMEEHLRYLMRLWADRNPDAPGLRADPRLGDVANIRS
jgi:GntR family transcriptional repressor for pyruvate dehydrogenase complex